MKTMLLTIALLAAIAAPAAAQAPDISGRWEFFINAPQGSQTAPMELKKEGDKFVGVFYTEQGNADVTATVNGKAVAFVLPPFQTENGALNVSMNGTLDGETMAGTLGIGDFSIDWTAKRSAAAPPAQAPAQQKETTKADVSGTWNLEVITPNGTGRPTLVLKQEGEKLSGTYSSTYGEFPVTGTITGGDFTFSIPMGVEGNTISIIYTGKADATSMKGTVTLGEMGEGTFSGKKK